MQAREGELSLEYENMWAWHQEYSVDHTFNITESALGWTGPNPLTTLRSDTMSATLFPA